MHTHICLYCSIDYTPAGNPEQSSYCSTRCREGAARARKRDRDKLVRPNMGGPGYIGTAYNKPGGIAGIYKPLEERYSPEFVERMRAGENPIRDATTNLAGEEQPTQTEVLMNLRKDGGALDSSAPQIETDKVIRVPLRKLTPDEITALSKKHLDEHGHEYKVVATVDDGRTHTGLRREKHLEKDIEGTHCAQCDKELPLDLEARADGFCSDECEKGFSERKLNS